METKEAFDKCGKSNELNENHLKLGQKKNYARRGRMGFFKMKRCKTLSI